MKTKIYVKFDEKAKKFLDPAPLTKRDILYYFRSIYFVKYNYLKKMGDFCQRCGIYTRKGSLMFTSSVLWKGFHLCDSCHEDKVTGKPELTPDIEDMARFGLTVEKIVGDHLPVDIRRIHSRRKK